MSNQNNDSFQKIGLFGGTFDPPHLGHLSIAEKACEQLGLDRLFFIPNKLHPFAKREGVTEARHREAMLRLAIKNDDRFRMDTCELQRAEISYTVDTVLHFRSRFPNGKLFLIVGQDNLAEFDRWKQPETILSNCQLVVFPRKTEQTISAQYSNRVLMLENPLIDISSTEIRRRLRAGEDCGAMLSSEVHEYILAHDLYPAG